MTVVVGTDVFGSIADSDTYWARRSNDDWTDSDPLDKEKWLMGASDYLERTFRWRGTKATAAQRLGWPRSCALDNDGFELTGIPWQVSEACFIVADKLRLGIDLEGVVKADSVVKMEKIDVITIEYDTTGANGGPAVLTHVYQMLSQVTIGDELLRS